MKETFVSLSRRTLWVIGIGVSVPVFLFLAWIMYFKGSPESPGGWVRFLPPVNLFLNVVALVCLVAGFLAIRRKDQIVHQRLMITAFLFSVLFLISYVTYHFAAGHTVFRGDGVWRPVYYSVLISHVAFAMVQVPLFLITLFLASAGRFHEHKRIARFTFPVCLYVSVTAVFVFVMLYGLA